MNLHVVGTLNCALHLCAFRQTYVDPHSSFLTTIQGTGTGTGTALQLEQKEFNTNAKDSMIDK
jgi:hypothetical protein